MKKLAFILLVLLSSAYALSAQAAKIVELSYSNWEPYMDPSQENKGLIAARVAALLQAKGYKARFIYFDSWAKAYKAAMLGKVDGTVGWACNYVRATQFYFSYPITSTKQVLFHLKKTPVKWQTTKDLSKYGKMGVTVGYFYGNNYQQGRLNGDFTIMQNATDADNFKQLLEGNIGTFLMDEEVGKRTLARLFKNQQQEITFSNHPLDQAWLHVMISRKIKGGAKIRAALDAEIKHMVKVGAMQPVPLVPACLY